MRTFISIDLPLEIIGEIKRVQEDLPEFTGKKTEPENLHLTLKFLGEVDVKKLGTINNELSKIKSNSFEAEIMGIGIFSPALVKIIWVEFKGAEELQRKIDCSLTGLFKKEKRFMGHLTIARVKNVKDKQIFLNDLNKIKPLALKFAVNSFKLKKSKLTSSGSVYETLQEYFLKRNIIKKVN